MTFHNNTKQSFRENSSCKISPKSDKNCTFADKSFQNEVYRSPFYM